MNFLKRFSKKPEEFFKELPLDHSKWTIVSWNWDLNNVEDRNATIELNSKNCHRVVWNNKDIIFTENKKINAFPHDNKEELKDLFNLSVSVAIKNALELHYDEIRKTSKADANAETRSLQWIQATFKTLYGALEKVKNNPDYVFTCAFFSGINPELNQRVLRLICFNLDINYFMLEDGSLRIVVFDDKNKGHGTQSEPSFHQVVKMGKPLLYDEIIKLLQAVNAAGEIR